MDIDTTEVMLRNSSDGELRPWKAHPIPPYPEDGQLDLYLDKIFFFHSFKDLSIIETQIFIK